jgi:hypothetical protein
MTPGDLNTHITRLIDALERADCAPRRSGRGWQARCPSHDDRTPSLRIDLGEDGRVLVHCFGGCDFQRILQALGLRSSALFTSDRHRVRAARGALRGASRPAQRDRRPPPAHEARAVWEVCLPVDQDCGASNWARARGLDPFIIADRDLCRALPTDATVPGWARILGATWPAGGYRLLLPLYDQSGRIASLHARNVRLDASPKGAFPAGCSAVGLVLADAGGRLMLRTAQSQSPLWIVEGVPDFLCCATAWGDAAEDSAPSIIAVMSGSWTPTIAARVPKGAEVIIAVHHDPAGESYLATIAESLRDRCLLSRWMPAGVAS